MKDKASSAVNKTNVFIQAAKEDERGTAVLTTLLYKDTFLKYSK